MSKVGRGVQSWRAGPHVDAPLPAEVIAHEHHHVLGAVRAGTLEGHGAEIARRLPPPLVGPLERVTLKVEPLGCGVVRVQHVHERHGAATQRGHAPPIELEVPNGAPLGLQMPVDTVDHLCTEPHLR